MQVISMKLTLWEMWTKSLASWSNAHMSAWIRQYPLVRLCYFDMILTSNVFICIYERLKIVVNDFQNCVQSMVNELQPCYI
jgi:hypothetical protein